MIGLVVYLFWVWLSWYLKHPWSSSQAIKFKVVFESLAGVLHLLSVLMTGLWCSQTNKRPCSPDLFGATIPKHKIIAPHTSGLAQSVSTGHTGAESNRPSVSMATCRVTQPSPVSSDFISKVLPYHFICARNSQATC
jgi:hypothetical protein